MGLNELALNGMAGWLAEHAPYLALHSADPGPTGLNETTATRVAATWPEPANGRLRVLGKTFTGGAPNGPSTYLGLWSAPTGGVFYGSGLLSNDVTFNAAGAYTVTDVQILGGS